MTTGPEAPVPDPRVLGRYRLLEKVGEGGMALVYKAEVQGPGGFAKLVALKLVHPHYAKHPQFIHWFMGEARLGGHLSHPNIVETLDFGEHGDQLYLAMEFIHGPTLEQILQNLTRSSPRAEIPIDITLQVIAQVLQALEYAHAETDQEGHPLHMVHRDLKPSNIFINRHGVVKLGDFGVARAESNLAHTLSSGMLKGTVRYMSPEQAWGQRNLDARSDLFAVGIILFEMLTLTPLYHGRTQEVILRAAQDAEVASSLERLPDSPLRGMLIDFLTRAFAREPNDRFQSAGEMLSALEPLLHAAAPLTPLKRWLSLEATTLVPSIPSVAGLSLNLPETSSAFGPIHSGSTIEASGPGRLEPTPSPSAQPPARSGGTLSLAEPMPVAPEDRATVVITLPRSRRPGTAATSGEGTENTTGLPAPAAVNAPAPEPTPTLRLSAQEMAQRLEAEPIDPELTRTQVMTRVSRLTPEQEALYLGETTGPTPTAPQGGALPQIEPTTPVPVHWEPTIALPDRVPPSPPEQYTSESDPVSPPAPARRPRDRRLAAGLLAGVSLVALLSLFGVAGRDRGEPVENVLTPERSPVLEMAPVPAPTPLRADGTGDTGASSPAPGASPDGPADSEHRDDAPATPEQKADPAPGVARQKRDDEKPKKGPSDRGTKDNSRNQGQAQKNLRKSESEEPAPLPVPPPAPRTVSRAGRIVFQERLWENGTVMVDGRAARDREASYTPGDHEVTVEKDGRVLYRRQVTLPPGGTLECNITVVFPRIKCKGSDGEER